MLRECRDQFGPAFTLRIVGRGTVVFFASSGSAEAVLNQPDYLQRGISNKYLRPIFGDHAPVMLDAQAHRRQRRIIAPLFERMKISAHTPPRVRAAARDALDDWPVGMEVDLGSVIEAGIIDATITFIFGPEVKRRHELRSHLLAIGHQFRRPSGRLS